MKTKIIDFNFIGELTYSTAEFASRWRRELASLDVAEGKNLSKQIKKSYSLSDGSPVPGKILSSRDREQNRLRENIYKEKDKAIQKRQSLKVNKTPLDSISSAKKSSTDRKFKLEKLKEKYGRNKPVAVVPNTPSSGINTKMDFDFSTVAKKSKLNKTKLGLAAGGLAATGAIGYGIYRKVRSDKGKKRT